MNTGLNNLHSRTKKTVIFMYLLGQHLVTLFFNLLSPLIFVMR